MNNFLDYNEKYKNIIKENTTELKDFYIIITNRSADLDLYITDNVLKSFNFLKSKLCNDCLVVDNNNIEDLLSTSCGNIMAIEIIKKTDLKKYFENIEFPYDLNLWSEEWNDMMYNIKTDLKKLIK